MATNNRPVVTRRNVAPKAENNANALAMFDPANIPAHIATFNEENANIHDRTSVNSLTFKGKVWSLAIGGNKEPIMRTNDDGDLEPRGTIPLVILGYNARRGRSYYDKGFDDGAPQQPTCWSPDGIAPDPSSKELQAEKCANCPMSVKGSRVTDQNKDGVACQSYRMAAVQLYRQWPDIPPTRLRLAGTSDFTSDAGAKENEANGWYSFSNLMDFLRSRGVKHTAEVIVKAKFDPTVAYPKILFSPSGWCDEDDLAVLGLMAKSEEVKALLSPSFTPAGGDNVATNKVGTDDDPEISGPQGGKPAKAPAKAADKPKPGKAPVKAKEPEPEPEPETDENGDLVEYQDGDGNPCDSLGNPLPTAEDAGEQPETDENGNLVEYEDGDGNPCDSLGNPLPAGDAVGDIVNQAEADDDDPEIAAKKAAEEARARAQAKQDEKRKAAETRAAAAKQTDPDDGPIVLGKPVAPKPVAGKPAVAGKPSLTPAKPAAAPVAAKANLAPGLKPKVTATVTPKAATPPTGGAKPGAKGPAAVPQKVGKVLQDWADD
jgi:hypothetical protein